MEAGFAGAVGVVLERGDAERIDALVGCVSLDYMMLQLVLTRIRRIQLQSSLTPDVDHPRRISVPSSPRLCIHRWRRRLLQQRREQLGEREDTLQVQRQQLSPRMVRMCVVGLAPSSTGVVDQNMESLFALAELGGKGFAGIEGLKIGGEGNGLTAAGFAF